jgi:hypothetical protein
MIAKSLFCILTIVTSKAGVRGAKYPGPENSVSEGPGNLGKMFVSFIILLYVYPK